MPVYEFPGREEFLDREDQLRAIEEWWEGDEELPILILYGRRRTGKSWLFRRFADGKEADIFVCDRRAAGQQLTRLAEGLQPQLGFVPRVQTMRDFFGALYGASTTKRLAVIDEFPELLSQSASADSELAAVLEEAQGRSAVRLIVCGSHMGTMQRLLDARAPLHGRARPLRLSPFPFGEARRFLAGHEAVDLVQRYAVAGGMPRYLRLFGQRQPLPRLLAGLLFDQNGALFDEPRTVLEMELSDTAVYFTLLEALSRHRELEWGDLLNETSLERGTASRYVRTLEELFIVEAAKPLLAPPNARRTRYRVRDHLMRFWFRFVFPFQDALTADLDPSTHYAQNVAPHLADHVAPIFEEICRAWVRREYPFVDRLGSWWGQARHDLRRSGQRTSEEIDVLGLQGRRATVVAECRWTEKRMPRSVLDDLRLYKLPALAQAGVDTSGADVCLFSRSGFTADLRAEAQRSGVRLVSLGELLA